MHRRHLRWIVVPAALAIVACDGIVSRPSIPKSQRASVSQRVGFARIDIDYGRPVARGRELFGGIVPYGEPWNPGANKATSIDFSRDVRVDGHALPAGKYSIWIVPDTAQWTFILSSAGDVFHIPYPEGKDALRLRVQPRRGPHMETLAFYFPVVDSTRAELVMHWGETVVPIQVEAP